MATPEVMRNTDNMLKIRKIAQEVHRVLSSFENTGKSYCTDCGNFLILDESVASDQQKIQDFVSKYKVSAWQPEFVVS